MLPPGSRRRDIVAVAFVVVLVGRGGYMDSLSTYPCTTTTTTTTTTLSMITNIIVTITIITTTTTYDLRPTTYDLRPTTVTVTPSLRSYGQGRQGSQQRRLNEKSGFKVERAV